MPEKVSSWILGALPAPNAAGCGVSRPDIASRSAEIRMRVFVMGGAFMGRIVLRSFIRGFFAAEFHRRSRPAAIASRV